MRLLSRLGAGAALAVTIAWSLTLALSGSTDALLFLAPALLILAPLLAGRYVGESLIVRLACARPRRRRRPGPAPMAPKAPALWLPRGTRLVAFSLAERPPPSLVAQT